MRCSNCCRPPTRTEHSYVPVDEPSWWYADTNTLLEHALSPAAWLYGRFARARLHRPPGFVSPLPVICVGNFTAGGTGKTPLARLIAEWLDSDGAASCVLTRGFGGRLAGPHMIDPTRDTATDVGDEALLLARICPVCLARNRAAGAQAIAASNPEHVIVMDDGLQNTTLHRDFKIAVVDAARGVGNRRVIPSGPLRAPLGDQLASVDCIVLNHGFSLPGSPQSGGKPGFMAWLREKFAGPILSAHVVPDSDTTWLQATPVVAYAGIANPQRFFNLLHALKADLRDTVAFRDHQMLSDANARALLDKARHDEATLVTTEKDYVRLSSAATGPRAELKRVSRTIPIRLQFEPADEQWLKKELHRVIEAVRSRQA